VSSIGKFVVADGAVALVYEEQEAPASLTFDAGYWKIRTANSFLVQCSERRRLDLTFHCIDVRPTATPLHYPTCAALGETELEGTLLFPYLLPLDDEVFGP
jgi:hypothetical protein